MKKALTAYAARHGLKVSRDYAIGLVRLLKRKGNFVLEVTQLSNSQEYAPGSVGFDYPTGVKALPAPAMISWLNTH